MADYRKRISDMSPEEKAEVAPSADNFSDIYGDRSNTPLSVDASEAANPVTPLAEIERELKKEEPDYFKVGVLGGVSVIALLPGLGAGAKALIKKGADSASKQAAKKAVRFSDETADTARLSDAGISEESILEADDLIFSWEKGELSNSELRKAMRDRGLEIQNKQIRKTMNGNDLEVVVPSTGEVVRWQDMPRGFAKGGDVKTDKQMEFLFEEGGMTDDGLDRDPVSGNEVPAGSLAEEVRDDIPAQLSGGEYVVPADVVRYYGVKFFEDLRGEAKEGLGEMEEDGRIGGEPVDAEYEDDDDLSDEERAELDSIMGMAVGGFVPQATVPQEAANPPADTQVSTTFPQFGPGFSFMGGASDVTVPAGPSRNVTLYGPNGEVVNLILPTQQAVYDDYISQGYGTEPVAKVEAPTVQTREGGAADRRDEQEGKENLSSADRALSRANLDDPLGAANAALDRSSIAGSIIGGVVGSALGPSGLVSGGRIGKTAQDISNLSEAAVNAEIAAAMGLDTTEIDASIEDRLANMKGLSKTLATNSVNRARKNALNALEDTDTLAGTASTSTAAKSSSGKFDSDRGGYSGPAPGDTSNVGNWGGDRDNDGVANLFDFNDGVGWADMNKDGSKSSVGSGLFGGGGGSGGSSRGSTGQVGGTGATASGAMGDGSRGGSSGGSSRGGAGSSPGAANEPEGGREGRYKGGLMGKPKGRKKKK